MSELEQKTKPLLLALSRDARHLRDLTHVEQRLLSRWAVKTALVLHAASYSVNVIPQAIYIEFYKRAMPLPTGIASFAIPTPDLPDDIRAVTALQSNRFMLLRNVTSPPNFRAGRFRCAWVYCSFWLHIALIHLGRSSAGETSTNRSGPCDYSFSIRHSCGANA